jgi:hypothetical protein
VSNNDDSLIPVPASNPSSGFARHFFHWSGSRRRRILSDGQSLVRRTLPRFLAVSTELANRAVSSICLAGLCDWSLACISFGFDPLSSSPTVGFRGILVSPWPFTVPTSIRRIGCGTCARFWDKDYDNGKLLDGLESMRRFTICFSNSQRFTNRVPSALRD